MKNSSNLNQEEENEYINSKIISTLLIIIISIGLVGNTLNIIIFSKPKMRQASTFRFLLYLSISDLLVLIFCSTDALARFGFQFEIRSFYILTCKIHTFLTYFLTHASSIILMVISVDRALVVTNKTFKTLFTPKFNKSMTSLRASPTRQKRTKFKNSEVTLSDNYQSKFLCYDINWVFLNFHRVDLVIGCVILLLIFLNIHYLFFINLNLIEENNSTDNESQKTEQFYICFPLENTTYFNFLKNIWIWVDICVYSIIPFIVMSICSTIILVRIRSKSRKYFLKLMSKNNQQQKTNFSKRLRRNRQLLYMLLLTNLYFLLSMLPYCVMFVLLIGKTSENSLEQPLVHTLLYTNNAINFVFYGLSSQKYRQELYSLFSKKLIDN